MAVHDETEAIRAASTYDRANGTSRRLHIPFHAVTVRTADVSREQSSKPSEPIHDDRHMMFRVMSLISGPILSTRSKELMLRQIAMLLRSGVDLARALRAVGYDQESAADKALAERLANIVLEGRSLSRALEEVGGFPEVAVQLARLGETSGSLPTTLEQSAETMEKRRMRRAEVLSTLAYPTVISIFAVALACYLIIAVIPELERFLTTMGRPLPPLTRQMVDMAHWTKLHAPQIIGGLISALVAATIAMRYESVREAVHRASLRLPIIGRLLQYAGTSSAAHAIGALTAGGVQLVDAFRIASRVQTNVHLRRTLEIAAGRLLRGQSPSTAIPADSGFLPMLTGMFAAAEKTGRLSESMLEAARFSDIELSSRLKRFSRLIEPLMIVVAGGFVGFVYMAFFTALMSAGTNIRS